MSGREAKETRNRRRGAVTRPTKAPLGGMSFKLYIYILGAITLAYAIYYGYRFSEIQRVKQQRVAERLQQARGKAPSGNQDPAQGQGQPLKFSSDAEMRNKLEQNIQELSQMLGIQPVVLASAIAGVVKPQIPVESSQSIASEAKASGDILSAFAEGMESGVTTPPQGTPTSDGGSVMSSIASVVQAVGFDDQGVGLD